MDFPVERERESVCLRVRAAPDDKCFWELSRQTTLAGRIKVLHRIAIVLDATFVSMVMTVRGEGPRG